MNALITTFGVDWHSLLFEVVNFAILVVVLTWLLYKPVLKMVSERQALVAKGVEDAEAAGALLAEADKESGKRITTAESQAEGIVQSARAEAGVEKARLMQEAESRAAQVERDAQARALEATERAKRESEKEIARLAILTAQKLMQKS